MRNIIFVLLLILTGYVAFAQNYGQPYQQNSYVQQSYNSGSSPLLPRPSFELATGLQLYDFKGGINDPLGGISDLYPNPSLYFLYTLMVSCNVPFKKINEDFYLGLNPNISLGYGSGSIGGDLPVYATLKWGAGSYRGCQRPFGIGVGAGGMVSGIVTTLGDVYGYVTPYSTAYVAPAGMVELTFDLGYGSLYQLRGDFTPVSVSKFDARYQGNISQYCIRVARIF